MNLMPLPLRCLSIVGLSLALTACDTPPTMVEQHFGLAVQRAQAQQSLSEPGAQQPMAMRCPHERSEPNCPDHHPHGGMGQGMSHGVVPGIGAGPHATHTPPLSNDKLRNKTDTDGVSALSAVSRYQQSFQTPSAPAPVFNIGLGAATAP